MAEERQIAVLQGAIRKAARGRLRLIFALTVVTGAAGIITVAVEWKGTGTATLPCAVGACVMCTGLIWQCLAQRRYFRKRMSLLTDEQRSAVLVPLLADPKQVTRLFARELVDADRSPRGELAPAPAPGARGDEAAPAEVADGARVDG